MNTNLFLCCAFTATLCIRPLLAAPPANDHFAAAQFLNTNTGALNTSNVDATLEIGEPGGRFSSIWYAWTPSLNGVGIVSTKGAGFDTYLQVYSGATLNSLSLLAFDRDSGGIHTSLVTFSALAGTTYFIRVTSAYSESTGGLGLSWRLASPPANDNFANRTPLLGDSGSLAVDLIAATSEPLEVYYDGWKSVWYEWTAPASGLASLATSFQNRYLNYLTVTTGTVLNALNHISGGYDFVTFNAVAGVTYVFRIGNRGFGSGGATLTWELASPPANDHLANASLLTGAAGSTTVNTLAATLEAGEFFSGSNSVWYQWTAPSTGMAFFDSLGSGRNTYLDAFTGNSLGTLGYVGHNDDAAASATGESVMRFPVAAGDKYLIRLSNKSGLAGSTTLHWVILQPPGNDRFAGAAPITGARGSLSASTFLAGMEDNEPFTGYGNENHSVWYSWTAAFTGIAQFDTHGTYEIDTRLMVCTGGALGQLNLIAQNDDSSAPDTAPASRVRFPVVKGTAYKIRVTAYSDYYTSGEGNFTLNWAPATDGFMPDVLSFSQAEYVVSEASPSAAITINRTIGSNDEGAYAYVLTGGGSATRHWDYLPVFTVVEFAVGETTRTLSVQILQDRRFEGAETVDLLLAYPAETAVFGRSSATLEIEDDEPFIPLKANYAGLVTPPGFDNRLAGLLKIHATGTGSFTGALLMKGVSTPIRGSLNESGKTTLQLKMKNGREVSLKLNHADNGNLIKATLNEPSSGKTAVIHARRVIYTGTVEAGDSPFAFTALIPGARGAAGAAPEGDGFMSVLVGVNGTVAITGVLADNTSFTASGPLVGHDIFPLYAPLYRGGGVIIGELVLQQQAESEAFIHWFKPATPARVFFADGFHLSPVVFFSPYLYSKRLPIISGVTANHGAADFNAGLAGLPEGGITQSFSLLEDNSIALPINPKIPLQLRFVPSKGCFAGAFSSSGKVFRFRGAVIQTRHFGSGFFMNPGSSPAASGFVEILPVQ